VTRECLARMGLDHPSGARERIYAALLHGALAAVAAGGKGDL